MIAAVYYGPGDVRVEETPTPRPGPGEVLIRTRAALTCGTDVKTWVRGHPLYRPPQLFGHEVAGEVVAAGEGVSAFAVGEMVVPHNSAPCGSCYYCKAGQPSMCDDPVYMIGAFAEYVLVPARIVRQNMFPVPEKMDPRYAALVEPLACAVYGAAETPIQLGDVVVVLGAGPIGLMLGALAARRGAHVIQVDLSAERLETAKIMGAAETLNPQGEPDPVGAIRGLTPGGRGADAVIEAVGLPEMWEQALRLVRKGGQVTLFGGCKPGTHISVDTKMLHYSQLTIRGLFHTTPLHVRVAFDLITGGQIPVEPLVSATMPLSRVVDALEMHRTQQAIKVALVP
ncbi:MAG: zinc-binding dehydrogenase [Firmicutes bacterium]|nr:zinc-binding dehydrogenase [Bacillota bacterium]